jgi:hypothetical protein
MPFPFSLPTPDPGVLDAEVVATVTVPDPDVVPEGTGVFVVPEVALEVGPELGPETGVEDKGPRDPTDVGNPDEGVEDAGVNDDPEILVLPGPPAIVEDPPRIPPIVVTCPFANVNTPLPV